MAGGLRAGGLCLPLGNLLPLEDCSFSSISSGDRIISSRTMQTCSLGFLLKAQAFMFNNPGQCDLGFCKELHGNVHQQGAGKEGREGPHVNLPELSLERHGDGSVGCWRSCTSKQRQKPANTGDAQ